MLGALDDVVVACAVDDEQTEAIEAGRAGHHARERDDELAVARADELLAPGEPPAAALLASRRLHVAHVRPRLRLGHRDRALEVAGDDARHPAALLLVGAEAQDHRRGLGEADAELDHRGRARARDHLDAEGGERERERAAAVGLGERQPDEAEVREALEVCLHRRARLHPATVADDPELVDLFRAAGDLGADVFARHREQLAPRLHGVRDVSVRAGDEGDDAIPRDDAIEGRHEIRVVEEVVHG